MEKWKSWNEKRLKFKSVIMMPSSSIVVGLADKVSQWFLSSIHWVPHNRLHFSRWEGGSASGREGGREDARAFKRLNILQPAPLELGSNPELVRLGWNILVEGFHSVLMLG